MIIHFMEQKKYMFRIPQVGKVLTAEDANDEAERINVLGHKSRNSDGG